MERRVAGVRPPSPPGHRTLPPAPCRRGRWDPNGAPPVAVSGAPRPPVTDGGEGRSVSDGACGMVPCCRRRMAVPSAEHRNGALWQQQAQAPSRPMAHWFAVGVSPLQMPAAVLKGPSAHGEPLVQPRGPAAWVHCSWQRTGLKTKMGASGFGYRQPIVRGGGGFVLHSPAVQRIAWGLAAHADAMANVSRRANPWPPSSSVEEGGRVLL